MSAARWAGAGGKGRSMEMAGSRRPQVLAGWSLDQQAEITSLRQETCVGGLGENPRPNTRGEEMKKRNSGHPEENMED